MADYSEEQLLGALRKADAAGDAAAARAIAQRLQSMRRPKATAMPDEPVDPLDGMGGLTRVRAGLGKSMADTFTGLRQAATDSATRSAVIGSVALNRLGMGGAGRALASSVAEPLRQSGELQREQIAEQRRIDAPLMNDAAGLTGNVAGTLAQIIGPGVALRGTAAGAAFLPRTVAGNALQGAVIGATQPVTDESERITGAAAGGAGGTVGAVVPKVVGAVARPATGALAAMVGRPHASGVERKAGEMIASEAGDLARLMQAAPSAVPGVQRTLAEESLDPGVARLERQMRGQSNMFDPIDRSNAAARVAAVEGIAGTEADMAAALAARDTSASGARTAAMAAPPAEVADTLRALDGAIAGARGRTAIQPALQALRDRLASYADDGGRIDMATLDNVRMDIGDMLSGKFGGDNAAALAGSRELIGVRDTLNSEASRQVPAFADYLSAYRQGSVPINRMQMGRELLERGAGGATPDPITGVRPLTPAAFSRQANDLDALAARATGFGKARADQILRPEDIATIKAIQDDLSRQQFRATAGSGGNSMTQERQELARRMGRSAVRAIPVVGSFAESLEAMGEQRLNQTLSRLLANPVEARRVLQSLSPQERSVVSRALAQLSASTGASAPALAE